MAWAIARLLNVFVLVVFVSTANADVVEYRPSGPSCEPATGSCQLIVKLSGVIEVADYEKLKRLIEQTHRQAESKRFDWDGVVAYLDSRGGDVDAAIAIGRLLRSEQASAHVGYNQINQGVCYSACVLVLAGATSRNMEDGKVGIHRPYLEVPKEAVSPDKVAAIYKKVLEEIRTYFREMNISERLAEAMLRIEPEQNRILDGAALRSFGLTSEDPISKEAKELQAAQKYGVDRQEYNRRKILAARNCQGPETVCHQRILETGRVDPTIKADEVDFSQFGRPVR